MRFLTFVCVVAAMQVIAFVQNSTLPSTNQRNPILLEIAKILQEPQLRTKFNVPVLILIAWQSAGKSSLVDLLTLFNIAPSGLGATTMFPVRFTLRDSYVTGENYARVDGKYLSLPEVHEEIKRRNIAQNGTLCDTEIHVEISRPMLPNVDILDLPGIPDEYEYPTMYRDAVRIIQKYARVPKSKIVAVGDGSAADATAPGHRYGHVNDTIYPVRPNWMEDAILIKNKVNLALNVMGLNQVNAYFKETLRRQQNREEFLVMLNPDKTQDELNMMSEVERIAWLKSVSSGGEMRFFEKKIQDIESADGTGAKLDADTLKKVKQGGKFGINAVGKHLEDISLALLLETLPEVRIQLDGVLKDKTRERERVEHEVDLLNPMEARRMYVRFVDDYYHAILALASFSKAYGQNPFSGGNVKNVMVDPQLYIVSFETEIKKAHFGRVYAGNALLPDYDKLIKLLEAEPSQGSADLLNLTRDRKLFGFALFDRFIQILQYVFMRIEIRNMSDEDELYNCGYDMHAGVPGVSATKTVACRLQDSIKQLSDITPWINDHLVYLWRLFHEAAVNSVVDRPNSPYDSFRRTHSWFLQQFDNHFNELLTEKVGNLTQRIDAIIDESLYVTDIHHTPFVALHAIASAPDFFKDLVAPDPPREASMLDGSIVSSAIDATASLFNIAGVGQGVVGELMSAAKQLRLPTGSRTNERAINTVPPSIGSPKNFDDKSATKWAQTIFHFTKAFINIEMRRGILAQYHYFSSAYLDNFRKNLQEMLHTMETKSIMNELEKSASVQVDELTAKVLRLKDEEDTLRNLQTLIGQLQIKHPSLMKATSRKEGNDYNDYAADWRAQSIKEESEAGMVKADDAQVKVQDEKKAEADKIKAEETEVKATVEEEAAK